MTRATGETGERAGARVAAAAEARKKPVIYATAGQGKNEVSVSNRAKEYRLGRSRTGSLSSVRRRLSLDVEDGGSSVGESLARAGLRDGATGAGRSDAEQRFRSSSGTHMRSLPLMAIGKAWDWIGMGSMKPFLLMYSRTKSGSCISIQLCAGRKALPKTLIFFNLRHSSTSSSERFVTFLCSV